MNAQDLIEQRLQTADRAHLHTLVLRLARAIDRNDRNGILACYHDEAIDDHGEYSGPAAGFADWVAMLYRERVESMTHLVANHLVDIDGHRAVGETYVQVYLIGRPAGNQRVLMTGLGRYLDRFERRDGVWRIVHRRVLTDFARSEALPVGDGASLVHTLHRGSASSDDPSYAHFSLLQRP